MVRSLVGIMSSQLRQGTGFALFFVGSLNYITVHASPLWMSLALAAFNVAAFGLSSFIGALFGGYVFHKAGGFVLFQVLSHLVLADLLMWKTVNKVCGKG